MAVGADPLGSEHFIDEQLDRTRQHIRGLDLATGLLSWLTLTIVALLGLAVIDHWILPLSSVGRWLGLGALVALSGYAVWKWLVPPLVRRVNPAYAARVIEQRSERLHNGLLNYLFLRSNRLGVHETVYQSLERRTAVDLEQVPWDNVFDHTRALRWAYVLLGVVAVCAGYKMLSPKDPLRTVARVLAPWSDLARPSRVELREILPGDTQVYHGQTLEVFADVRGLRPNELPRVVYSTVDGQTVNQLVELELASDGLRYAGRVPPGRDGARQNLIYRVEAGDAVSRDFRVEVLPAPTIVVERVEYEPPSYTGASRSSVENQGDLRGVEGTKVTIHARGSLPIKSAYIEFDPLRADASQAANAASRILHLTPDGDRARQSFVLQLQADRRGPLYSSYQVRFVAADGTRSEQPIVHSIEVSPDLGPEVEFLAPRQAELSVRENDSLPIEVRAIDPDFGVARLTLRAERSGDSVLEQILVDDPRGVPGQVLGKYDLVPRKLQLNAGDEISLWAEVQDNKVDWKTKRPAPNLERTSPLRIKILPADERGAGKEGDAPASNDPDRAKPNEKPGDDSAANSPPDSPSAKPDSKDTRGKPSGKDKASSGGKDGNTPGQSGAGEKPSDKPSDQPSDKPSEKASDKPGEKPGQTPGDKPSDKPSDKPGDGSSSKPGEKPGEKPGSKPGEKPGDSSSQQPSDGTGQNSPKPSAGQKPGDQSGDSPMDNPGEKPQGKPGEKPAQKPNAGSGEKPMSPPKPGDNSAQSKSGESKPGNQGKPDSGDPQQSGSTPDGAGDAQSKSPAKGGGGASEASKPNDPPNGADPNAGGTAGKPNAGGQPTGEASEDDPNGGAPNSTGAKPGSGSASNDNSRSATKPDSSGNSPGNRRRSNELGEGSGNELHDGDVIEETLKHLQAKREAQGRNTPQPGQPKPSEQAGNAVDPSRVTKPEGPDGRANDGAGGSATKPKGSGKPQGGTETKPEGGEPKPTDKPIDPGQGQNGEAGAGDKPDQRQGGAPSPTKPPLDRPKTQQPDGSKPDGAGEPPTQSESEKQSDSKGGQGGDRAGGGRAGGGQGAKQPGNDSAGSSSSADEGNGRSKESGSGETGDKGGSGKPGDRPTGKPGQDKGKGSGSKPGDSGTTPPPGGQPGAKPPAGAEGAPGQQPPKTQAEGSPSNAGQRIPTTGGGQAGSDGAGSSAPAGEVPLADEPNVDYARRATDLVLDYLKDQKANPDQELLDRLGWTPDDLRKFLDRWERLKTAADRSDPNARRELDESLRSLGLRAPKSTQRGAGAAADTARGNRDDGQRTAPPSRYLEQFKAFRKGTSRTEVQGN